MLLYVLLLSTAMAAMAQEQLHPIPSISVSCPDTAAGHWECGRQIGHAFRDRIGASFADPGFQKGYSMTQSPGLASSVFLAMRETAHRVYPLYVKELEGTAAGSNQSFDLMMYANMEQEIGMATAGNGSNIQWRSSIARADHCSDAFLNTAFAHNEDGGFEDFDKIYFVRLRTYDSSGKSVDEFAGITYPGRLPGWGPGWNVHQLAWSSNVMYAKPPRPLADGVSVIFVSRDITRAQTIEEAIRRGTPAGLMAGQNLNFGSFRDGRVVTVETYLGGKFDMLEVTAAVSPTFHANEYLRMKVPQDEEDRHLWSARHRRAAFQHTPAPQSVTDLVNFLGDTSDKEFPVFRRNDTTHEFTLLTVAFDLEQGTVEWYRANPRQGKGAMLWREWIKRGNSGEEMQQKEGQPIAVFT